MKKDTAVIDFKGCWVQIKHSKRGKPTLFVWLPGMPQALFIEGRRDLRRLAKAILAEVEE